MPRSRAVARAHLERGEPDAAIALLEEFGARWPEAKPALAQLLGRALYAKGDLAGARAELEQAVSHRPDDALAHLYLGLVLGKSGDSEGAAHELHIARETDPSLFPSARPREPTPFLDGHFSFVGGAGIEYDTNPTVA